MQAYTPSRELLKAAKAALLLRDSSLSEFARSQGVARQNLCKALAGNWTGPRAASLVERTVETLELSRFASALERGGVK